MKCPHCGFSNGWSCYHCRRPNAVAFIDAVLAEETKKKEKMSHQQPVCNANGKGCQDPVHRWGEWCNPCKAEWFGFTPDDSPNGQLAEEALIRRECKACQGTGCESCRNVRQTLRKVIAGRAARYF